MRFVGTLILLSAFGCAETTLSVQQTTPVRRSARWAMLPVSNYTETPQAGERAEAILETVLRKRGVAQLDHYPPSKEDDAHLTTSERQHYEEALAWARAQRYDYVVSGALSEWRYKGGVEGEPAVGITINVLELSTGKTVFSASGARTGGGGDNASATAQRVIGDVLEQLTATP